MESSFAWLDYSDAQRRQMVGIIDQFRDKTTVDELGFGSIRDMFADRFFPGITTIQTRARYLLFVPWIYQAIERDGVPYQQVDVRARHDQARLAAALQRGGEGDAQGVIGILAGEKLLRTPAVVYWNALRRFGLWTYSGNLAQYYQAKLMAPSDSPVAAWHPGMPKHPSDWLDTVTLALTGDEADYLRERINIAAPGTLLSICIDGSRNLQKIHAPWEHPGYRHFPRDLKEALNQARLFAILAQGASLLYELMLAETAEETNLRVQPGLSDLRIQEMDEWAAVAESNSGELSKRHLTDLWHSTTGGTYRISSRTREFVEAIMTASRRGPGNLATDEKARVLVRHRELALKGGLARLTHLRALETNLPVPARIGQFTYRGRLRSRLSTTSAWDSS